MSKINASKFSLNQAFPISDCSSIATNLQYCCLAFPNIDGFRD